jgi:chromosome segregation ATPase
MDMDMDLDMDTSHEDMEQSSPEEKKPVKSKSKKRARDGDYDSEEDEKHSKRKTKIISHSANDRARVQKESEDYQIRLDRLAKSSADVDGDAEEDDANLMLTRSSMEAGQIVEMYLQDFMCHRKFTMNFCKNVNFISGKNGSGKSSIVSALQVCLGSTAKTAGRGSRMEEYIRENCAGPAIIRITMINEGADAFHPEIYGKRITVERRIARSSGSCYILSDENGREVSRKKSDLEKMLQMFNIYVDNPCNVMTQEESKKFIRSKNTEKYTFFLKATGLNRLREDLVSIQEDISEAEIQAEKQHDRISQKAQSVKEIEELLNKMKELESLEDRIRIGQAKMYWDDLRVAEDDCANLQQELEEKENQLEQAKSAYEKAINADNNTDDKVARINANMEELTKKTEQLDQELSVKQSEISRSNADLRAAKADFQKLERARDDFLQRKANTEQQINELRQRALQSAESDTRGIVEEMTAIERKIDNFRKDESVVRNQKLELDKLIPQAETATRRVNAEANSLKSQISNQKNELQNMLRASNGIGRNIHIFGSRIAEFYQEVQRKQSSFHHQVFGPLGMHLSVKEEFAGYSRAIERAIGPSMFAFVVTNHDDRRTLQGMLSKFSGSGPIQIIMQSPQGRYSLPTLPSHVVTAISTLQVDSDVVFNALVDQASLDRTALVLRTADASSFVEQRDTMKMLKYGLHSIVDNERCDVVQYRNGNASSDPNRYGFHDYLAKDMSSAIESLQQDIRAKEKLSNEYEAQVRAEQDNLRSLRAQDHQITQRLREIADSLRHNHRQLDVLQQRLEEANEAGRIDTSVQEQERADLELAIADIEPRLQSTKDQLMALDNASRTLGQAKKELEGQKQRVFSHIQEQQQEIEQLLTMRANERRKADTLKRRWDERKRDVEMDMKKVEKSQGEIETALQVAEERTRSLLSSWDGNRLKLTRHENRNSLDRQVRELQAKFNAAKRLAGLQGYSLEILQDRFDNAHSELEEMKSVFEMLANNIESLKTSQKEREAKWSKALRHCTKVVKSAFDTYASRRGSAGTVRFDHKEGVLDIQVQVDSTDEHTVANDIMNLSGGERSYVTFCLQLALGHVVSITVIII